MSVEILSVEKNSPCFRAGIEPKSLLISINNHEIEDVLDYRFYQNERKLKLVVETNGKQNTFKIVKEEYEELGLIFETYLMDEQHACKNKCIFCFIDQLPKGLRPSLYFKDDDSRLSFLFGNYITLTNITEHEVERIIRLHISPVNISIHTTNPQLRCQMMHNRFAGDALQIFYRLAKAGIAINCQLVLCPDYNDGQELERTLNDLIQYETVRCIAAVPVGLTGHRQGLEELTPFNAQTAAAVIDTIDRFQNKCLDKYGERRVYAADEFYLLARRTMPTAEFYGDFLQLENGVGMWALLLDEVKKALKQSADKQPQNPLNFSVATGEAAADLMKNIVDKIGEKWHNLKGEVYPIQNNFFGGRITVTGLVTGGDIIKQLKGKKLGSRLLISSSMLRKEGDLFLDDITPQQVADALQVELVVADNDGFDLIDAVLGKKAGFKPSK